MAGEGILATLQAAWEALSSVDAPKAVIGGLALVAWKHARYTRDADILVAIEADRIDELVRVLANAGFQARHEPPLRLIDGQGIAQFTYQPPDALMPFQCDLLLVNGDFQRTAVARAMPWPLRQGALEVRVVRPDDLIVIKLLAGSIIDRADAAMILRENRDDIDFDHLQREVNRQGVDAEYREIWREAFPDEAPPG
jgi:hypothetical protein